MLSNCQMIQNYGAVLAQRFGETGTCITHIHLVEGGTVVGTIDGFNHTTLEFPDGRVLELQDVKSISEIFKATKKHVLEPIASLDVEFKIAGKSFLRHIPGAPTNPELLATAYRDIVKELLSNGNAQ